MPLSVSRALFSFILFLVSASSVIAQPMIESTADPLDFGTVQLTDVKDSELTIESKEATPIIIQNIFLANGNARPSEFQILSPSIKTFPLDPTEKRKIIIRFSPDFDGLRTRQLILQTDKGDKVIQLQGTGELTTPKLALSVTDLNFGQISLTGKKELAVEVTNVGEDAAKISDVNIANFNGVEHFKARPTNPSVSFPVVLQKDEKLSITVSFEGGPPVGFKTGSLTLVGNVGGQTVVSLEGEVVQANILIEPSPLDFGDVDFGTTVTRKLTLTVVGSLPVKVEYMNDLTQPFEYVDKPDIPLIIEPGKPVEIEIRLSPTTSGPLLSEFQLTSPDLENGFFRSASITANVLTPLRVAESQDFTFYCEAKQPTTRTTSISNRAVNPIEIDNVVLPAGVILLSQLPAEIGPTGSAQFDYAFDPSTSGGDRQLIFEYQSNGATLIRDTVDAELIQPNIILNQTAVETAVSVASDFDLTAYQLTDLNVRIQIAQPDLFSLLKDSIVLDPAIFPNATFDLIDLGGGVYDLEIHSPSPIMFDPAKPLEEQTLFTYHPRAFVTTDGSSDVTVTLSNDLCASIQSNSITLTSEQVCGGGLIRDVLAGQPLGNIQVISNPVTSDVLGIRSEVMGAATITLVDLQGREQFRSTIVQGEAQIDVSHLPAGVYLLRARTQASNLKDQLVHIIR